jgi:hypothetical protein
MLCTAGWRHEGESNMRGLPALAVALVLACALGCTTRARRPDGPYRDAEEFADHFSDEAVACTREHDPQGEGRIVVEAEFTGAGNAPVVNDAGSLAGSERVIACIRQNAQQKLRSPAKAPARFVRITVPVPLVTSNVTYSFSHQPGAASAH